MYANQIEIALKEFEDVIEQQGESDYHVRHKRSLAAFLAAKVVESLDRRTEDCARIAEAPFVGYSHTPEAIERARAVNQIAANIRKLKTPKPKRQRRLK